ncbi:opacity family porin [Neisseria gonorrhoeae]|uniref:opacity family porin n=1 Tax=Neisseria gonorrhoeae TaxID=485 RepID=UPI000F5BFE5D|nr:opacity family porin [Neisseria gonorrhoeae]AZG28546.1 autotransporter outer membrane beta-barrel domain-containing protein [Neisseria gonorrhoeae]
MQPAKNLLFSSLLFSSLLFSSAAQAASEDGGRGPYVQADLAYAYEHITRDYPDAAGANQGKKISTVSDYFRNIRTRSVHPRVSVGYDFGSWRIAADYARYRKWNDNKYSVNIENVRIRKENGIRIDRKTENQENGSFHAVSSLGLSAVYDFKLNDKFKPYIGARVAYGHVRHSIDSTKKTTGFLTTAGARGAESAVRPSYKSTQDAHHQSNSIRRVGLGVIAGVGFDITPNLTLDAGYRYHNWGRLENTRFKTHEASLGVRYRF